MPFYYLLSFFFWCCVYIYIYIYIFFFLCLPHTPSCSFFLLQVEVPSPATSGTIVKEVVVAQPITALSVEKEPPSGGNQ